VCAVRLVLATLLVGVLMVAAGCGGHGSAGGSGKLEPISNVDRLERAFDDESGHARLVLLLSPT
jgi:hypothetical protein